MPVPRRVYVTLNRALDVAAQQFPYQEDFDPTVDEGATKIVDMLHAMFGEIDDLPYWRCRGWYVQELWSRMSRRSEYDCENCEDAGCEDCDPDW
jgi:hypothetical protein